jgi:uncharacterized cupredoxin-like copper-binding protein
MMTVGASHVIASDEEQSFQKKVQKEDAWRTIQLCKQKEKKRIAGQAAKTVRASIKGRERCGGRNSEKTSQEVTGKGGENRRIERQALTKEEE